MDRRLVSVTLVGALVGALPAAASAAPLQKNAAKAADAFKLDLGNVPVDDQVVPPRVREVETTSGPAVVSAPEPAPPQPAPAAPDIADAPTDIATFGLDTPIRRLIADPAAKAILDRDLPGLSDDENLAKFRDLSLRQFQPMTGGQLTMGLIEQVGRDLATISPGGIAASESADSSPSVTAPATKTAPARKRRFEGR
ncbi:hypothetical protein SAMN05192583_0365 [Sphingomonas gellani]|uniref:Uncharacterized protein n=1 Tax=Sphingomonas gellani TaxID=1166340 RepID=A0A1H7YQS8_9SPHN|nr:hypothetical protein [Sphingomonas gellani]SEM48450.1 hypothetical protein SAMN05192583_0365 [Sphingomonas gellani]